MRWRTPDKEVSEKEIPGEATENEVKEIEIPGEGIMYTW